MQATKRNCLLAVHFSLTLAMAMLVVARMQVLA